MKALDTNILIRFLIKDDEKQAEVVYKLFKNVEQENSRLFIPLLVILETIWVLEAVYSVERLDILQALDNLMAIPYLEFENQSIIRKVILVATHTSYDLSDLLIAHSAQISGCESILTFDKKASRYEAFELLHFQ